MFFGYLLKKGDSVNELKMMSRLAYVLVSLGLPLSLMGQNLENVSFDDLCQHVRTLSREYAKLMRHADEREAVIKACPTPGNCCGGASNGSACDPIILRNVGAIQILTLPGVYCMAEDLLDNLQVLGSDITIDMNGHTLLAQNNGLPGIVVTGGVINVRIKNGLISGPSLPTNTIGLGIFDAFETRIEDVTIERCSFGIILFGDQNPYSPYNDQPPVDTLIQRVICHDNLLGFFCINDFNTRFVDCISYDNGFGIGSQGSTQMFAQGVECRNNQQQGFNVQGPASSAEFVQCVSRGNNLEGFTFDNANDVVVRDCYAVDNNGSGFGVNNGSSDIAFFNCIAESNGLDGFALFGNSASFFNCVATFNGQNNNSNGFNISPNITALVQGCTAESNFGHGFNTTNSANQFYSNVACNNGFTNYNGVDLALISSPANVRGVHNTDCDDTTPDQIEEILAILDSQGCGIIPIINTGVNQTITVPGKYCLMADLFNTILIQVDGVILDLNAHTISPQPGAAGIVVDTNISDVRISNGFISGGSGGASSITVSSGASDVVIEDITCQTCSTGIVLDTTQRVILRRIHSNFHGGDGISTSGDIDTIISNSSCISNGGSGITSTSSQNLLVSGCQVSANAVTGLYLVTCSHAQIENTVFSACGTGITVQQSDDVVIRYCFALNSGGAGFNLQMSSSNVFIYNSYALTNGIEGFFVDGTITNSVIRECTANANSTGFGNSVLTASQFYSNSACNNGGNFGGAFNAAVVGANTGLYWQNVDCDL